MRVKYLGRCLVLLSTTEGFTVIIFTIKVRSCKPKGLQETGWYSKGKLLCESCAGQLGLGVGGGVCGEGGEGEVVSGLGRPAPELVAALWECGPIVNELAIFLRRCGSQK